MFWIEDRFRTTNARRVKRLKGKSINKVFKVLITVTNCEQGKQNHICNLSDLDFYVFTLLTDQVLCHEPINKYRREAPHVIVHIP